ncbi:hypothetical protein C8Q80DRAFT_1118625 [Daedaleopsis nitida]|nr:hypothetical protein C8Q80DRAFT_1118625 [Daedaleopsis nitida]
MQLSAITIALFALAASVVASPQTDLLEKRNACRRTDGSIELREWDGSLITRTDGCTLDNAGGSGAPIVNSWCQATYGHEYPCCVENGVGGAYCTTCTRGIHNC